MDIKKIQEQFIRSLEEKGRSHSTIVAYKKDISQLMEFLQGVKNIEDVSKISSKDLEEYVENLSIKGEYTLKTISRKINSLKTFCKYMLSEQLIVEDVSIAIKHPELQPQLPRVLSPMEYRALRDVARDNIRLYTMVELLLQTGIRIGELSRLKLDQVKLDGRNKYITVESFSSNPERRVELNVTIAVALKKYLANRSVDEKDKGYLFKTKSGNLVLIRNIRTAVNRAFEKAGIKGATVNDIRNTFIVYQLNNGIDIEKLAEIVGHQKPTTTERYLQMVESRPKRSVNQVKAL